MALTATKNQTVQEPQPLWTRRAAAVRVVLTAAALIVWFWTQGLIGKRALPDAAIGDRLLAFTAPANFYLHVHPRAANLLLIVSSAIIDALAIFILWRWIIQGLIRPFLALVIVLGLRQIMQALVALPAPPNAIWHYPGFPSLLVTYSVSNDYFFSGHTAIAVLAGTELARIGKRRLTAIAVLIGIFEIATVLVLRAHYTMDVFTGVIAGLYAAYLASCISAAFEKQRSSEMSPG